jgi:NAD(P)-dependent dehydrogenase (short-subunit alcohol dehydrogenase family)
MLRFAERTVVVTGGASGIGATTARRLAEEGARVIVLDRTRDAGIAIATEIGGDFVEVDLADRASIAAAGADVLALAPKVHGLVNNAGIARGGTIDDFEPADWDLQMSILLAGPAFLTQALAPGLLAAEGAAVVNVSSEVGFLPRPSSIAYASAKAGVMGLTRAIAADLGPRGVRVNAVAPGPTVTEMHTGTGEGAAEKRSELEAYVFEDVVLPRLGRPAHDYLGDAERQFAKSSGGDACSARPTQRDRAVDRFLLGQLRHDHGCARAHR